MGRKLTETQCKVQIVKLSLNKTQIKQCYELLEESGKCYSEMILAHVESRKDKWLSEGELKAKFKGAFKLHSQTIQSVAEKINSNLETAKTNRDREFKTTGKIKTEYASEPKRFFSVTWKKLGIKIQNGKIHLSNGLKNTPLIVSLPLKYSDCNVHIAELILDAGVFYLHLTVDTGIVPKNPIERLKTAGVDMGEIHIAYCTADDGNTIGISGRQLRSVKQLRNKRFASLDEQLSKCKNGSRRHKKLSRLKRKASSKLKRQQRDILHKASRQLVNFCEENKVANIAIGDVRNISDGVDLGKKTNQKISQWAHGQFSNYVKQKAKTIGISTKLIDESYSSKTCSVCGHVKKNSVQGRNYHCKECQSKVHRDANGSANICSKARYGEYSKVQVNQIKYLKPLKIGFSRPSEARQVADKMLANTN